MRPAAPPRHPDAGRPRCAAGAAIRLRLGAAVLAAGVVAMGVLAAAPAPPAAPPERDPHDATTHHRFTGIDKWVRIFDDPGRDLWQKPAEVVGALGLRPGMIVADIGAGTGYFMGHLARSVSPGGIVLAIDTEPEMVQHMAGRAVMEKLDNAVPVLGLPDDPFLPRRRLDRVLIINTYHHVDDRLQYFERVKGALAPGGRLVVIDFHKRPLPVGPSLEHKLAREFVVEEMRQGGWRLAEEKTFLPYQYFLIFAPGGPGADHR